MSTMKRNIMMTGMLLSLVLACSTVSAEDKKPTGKDGPATKAPTTINMDEYRDKVYACWLGKTIGGTLGGPGEGSPGPLNRWYYVQPLQNGRIPASNDEVDTQLVFLKALEKHNGDVDARILADYWLKYIGGPYSPYCGAQRKLRMGFMPPMSGTFLPTEKGVLLGNYSNGSWASSEIWACIAPGQPLLAAQLARNDGMVYHGRGEGTLGAAFFAAVESAAFIEKDRDRLIAIGLSVLPEDSRFPAVVRAIRKAKESGKTWLQAREDIIALTKDPGTWLGGYAPHSPQDQGSWTSARDLGFTLLGWFYGDGDFGKSICIAVNCGEDTDTQGASLGALLGILAGARGIPEKWTKPLGDPVVIHPQCIHSIEFPKDLSQLTDRTVAMGKMVLTTNNSQVRVSNAPTDLVSAKAALAINSVAAKDLWSYTPWQSWWTEDGIEVVIDYREAPYIEVGTPRSIHVSLRSVKGSRQISAAVIGLPPEWKVTGIPDKTTSIEEVATRLEFVFTAESVKQSVSAMKLELRAGPSRIDVPLSLISARVANNH